MEADQELLVFLNAIQLKILWSMLVSTFVACFTVFYDLLNPFYGGYQVSGKWLGRVCVCSCEHQVVRHQSKGTQGNTVITNWIQDGVANRQRISSQPVVRDDILPKLTMTIETNNETPKTYKIIRLLVLVFLS